MAAEEIGKLNGFGEGDLGQSDGVGANPRIGGEDTIHIGPDPHLVSIHRCAKNGAGVVGAAAAESGHLAGRRCAAVAHHDGNAALLQERVENVAAEASSRFHVGRSIAEFIIGGDDADRVDKRPFRPEFVQTGREDVR